MSARSTPLEELERFFERMSRQFEDAPRMWDPSESLGRWASEFGSMAIDLVDRDDEFVVTVDMPGFEREEIAVRVTDHTLRIEADQRDAHDEMDDEDDSRYIRQERRHKSIERSIRLPDDIDTEGVTATMKNGVLTVTLPKLDLEPARDIDIDIE